jgi:Uma2 family endonuclease
MTLSPIGTNAHPTSIADDRAQSDGESNSLKTFKFRDGLPTAAELPDSDDEPVDSELQELIPGLLKAILLDLWADRTDWIFGIDLGIYYDPDLPCIAPDGFLSLGIREPVDENLRPSYVLWDEGVVPLFALEVVSKAYRQEHSRKLEIYQSIGVLYYVVYAPLRKKQPQFQVYKLVDGNYVEQVLGQGSYWMPEVGLGIGVERRAYGGRVRDWLYWYDEGGRRLLTPSERAVALRERLLALGVNPDELE